MIRFGNWKSITEKAIQSDEPIRRVEDGTTLDSKIDAHDLKRPKKSAGEETQTD